MVCLSKICPCRWHSMKIKADFLDIFEVNFTPEEEREIVERFIGKSTRKRRDKGGDYE